MRKIFPGCCASAASGTWNKLSVKMTASPISRMVTSVEGRLAGV
jgi:hypothetical protein